ncbi:BppU family phage baseplate upper protein [Staphylococcus saprophyticus]|nr:BppU family phage baseplate upper protein [Staphylococcus saprophyticus]MDW4257142.1 BppU family phage baseplate upper protein [Staphylococcus saprophyticus]
MSINKIKGIPLETTASYQALSQLGVQFWNQDRQTAILQFQITRNNYPLALSEENVKVFIALESGDSFLVDDKLKFVDQLNGVVSYTIPADFMRVAKEVKGQVYVTTLDEEEVVVQRQFTFNVANDLIADLPAEDKIREIKYFSDMRAEVAQMMTKLNSDFEHMNDYVTQVQDTTQQGIAALTKLIDDKEKAYNDNHEAKMKELDDKGTSYTQQLDEDKQYMDEKFEAFKTSVNGSGVVTTGQSKDWQKVKLTSDSGIRTYLTKGSVKDIKALNVGFYETVVAGTTDASEFPKISYGSFVELDVMKSDAGRMQVKLVISGTGRTFNRYIHTDASNDTGWLEMPQFSDVSTMETTSGSQAKATTAENNAKQYTDNKVLNDKTLIYNGSANGVGTDLNLSETLDNFIFLYIYGNFDGGYFTETGDPNGTFDIVIDRTNVIGTDGGSATVFECIIRKMSRTQLKIISDIYHGIGTNNGSGPNANRFTITKIVGVRKYADISQ